MNYVNGCSRSEIKVTPANWQTNRASVKKNWKIYYRYYDPATKGTKDWGKMIQIRGMNDDKDLQSRQATTKFLLEQEKTNSTIKAIIQLSAIIMLKSKYRIFKK